MKYHAFKRNKKPPAPTGDLEKKIHSHYSMKFIRVKEGKRMDEQLTPKTTYLVSVGNLFISNPDPLVITRLSKGAMEFEYEKSKQVANDVGGEVIRKTMEYARVVEF